MPRKTIIFGNGLGRALDNDFFQLPAAMKTVWETNDLISNDQRRLIASAIEGVEVGDGPTNEEELFGTQLALMAFRVLQFAVKDDELEHWLTKDAISYPEALQRYTYMVAKYFHGFDLTECDNENWEPFIDALVGFIFDSKSHVATLNYDTLLYAPFNEEREIGGKTIQLCSGFSGTLRDGYTANTGFSDSNMQRKHWNQASAAFYMHLHGSPLFVDAGDGTPKKINRSQLAYEDGSQRSHIVLTNGKMKPSVIQASKVLQMYWDHLPVAIGESEEIVIFGYSGCDDHLNKLIKNNRSDKTIKVVQRTNGDPAQQKKDWKNRLGGEVNLVTFDNILEFRDW
ncbi:hypothetical protein FHS72_000700 [Loktanella ponticola]|uniref:SIR2-like domain-containing protein n=1 Tax=Yoonia ponticola TaxID=1524255 RepID=A0A7W9BID2_9RHOB|nr:hypothetical protein [Yoonia ponticola]MBB5721093.1 hypothetical protein [Yoonia ponticola]